MKYQAEIIPEILEQRGHKKSSLHYQSECIEKWIAEAKGAYPKLCDYESEWLNYISILDDTGGSEKPPIGEFPYIVLTDVTEATVDNVVPLAYKSAILKGNTLVNLVNGVTSNEVGNYNSPCKINVIRNLQNETLTIIFNVTSLEIPDGADGIMRMGGGMSGTIRHKPTVGINKVLYNCTQQTNNWLGVFSNSEAYKLGQRITISDVMVLEGDHTQEDIPYFDGMQSVKMPVLTTTGKNLFGSEIELGGYTSKGNPYTATDRVRSKTKTLLKKGTYTLSCENATITIFSVWNINNTFSREVVSSKNFNTFTFDEDVLVNIIIVGGYLLNSKIQIEEGSTVTSYESFKSNILTVNEDVTLRSNGNICDELNLLTGQLTQRIDEDGEVLSQEVVKTVELSITDESGNKIGHFKPIEGTMHIQTNGEPIKPTVTMEIPVEATAQNLASFIDLD